MSIDAPPLSPSGSLRQTWLSGRFSREMVAGEHGSQSALLISLATILVLAASVFVRMMNYDMRRDEQLYVSPAALLPDLGLYSDFFYNHVPSSAWLFHAFHSMLPDAGLLLSSRLAVFVFWLLFAIAIWFAVWILSRSAILALFAVLACAANELVLGVAGMTATNNLLPLPLALAGTAFFIAGADGEKSWIVGLSGLFLALAATFKASAVCYIPPVVIAAFLLPGPSGWFDRARSIIAPLAAGGIAGALPVLVYLAADPNRFLAHVVGFHIGPHVDYWQAVSSGEVAMGIGGKVQLATDIWLSGAGTLSIFVIGYLVLNLIVERRARQIGIKLDWAIILLFAMFAVAAVFSFLPTPSFPQYYALPLAILPLLMATLYRRVDAQNRTNIDRVLIVGIIILGVLALPRLGQHLPKAAHVDRWQVAKVHRTGEFIAAALAERGQKGKVATLLPIYALEGGNEVYAELATGQFIYRSADKTEATLRANYKTTSPSTITRLLNADPPAAILVGFEPELERPLLAWAKSENYQKVADFKLNDRYGTGELYLRPGR